MVNFALIEAKHTDSSEYFGTVPDIKNFLFTLYVIWKAKLNGTSPCNVFLGVPFNSE